MLGQRVKHIEILIDFAKLSSKSLHQMVFFLSWGIFDEVSTGALSNDLFLYMWVRGWKGREVGGILRKNRIGRVQFV